MAGLPHCHLCSELIQPITGRKPRAEKAEAQAEADSLWPVIKC